MSRVCVGLASRAVGGVNRWNRYQHLKPVAEGDPLFSLQKAANPSSLLAATEAGSAEAAPADARAAAPGARGAPHPHDPASGTGGSAAEHGGQPAGPLRGPRTRPAPAVDARVEAGPPQAGRRQVEQR